jgi:hypothetical protein
MTHFSHFPAHQLDEVALGCIVIRTLNVRFDHGTCLPAHILQQTRSHVISIT